MSTEQERKAEVIYVSGCVQKDGEKFTGAEVEAFMDDWLAWLKARGLGFGGGIGGVHDDAEYERIFRHEQASRVQELEREVEALRTALEFYSYRTAYLHDDTECPPICEDEGDRARAALANKGTD